MASTLFRGALTLAEVLGRVGAEEKAVGPHRLGRPGEEAPGHRVGRLVGADVVLQGVSPPKYNSPIAPNKN